MQVGQCEESQERERVRRKIREERRKRESEKKEETCGVKRWKSREMYGGFYDDPWWRSKSRLNRTGCAEPSGEISGQKSEGFFLTISKSKVLKILGALLEIQFPKSRSALCFCVLQWKVERTDVDGQICARVVMLRQTSICRLCWDTYLQIWDIYLCKGWNISVHIFSVDRDIQADRDRQTQTGTGRQLDRYTETWIDR